MEEVLERELHNRAAPAPEEIQPHHLISVEEIIYEEEHHSSVSATTTKTSTKKIHFNMDEEEDKMNAEGP